MWIRSQNKSILINANNITIRPIKPHAIISYFGKDELDFYLFGEYESKERALEVLDMIESQLRISTGYTVHEMHLGDNGYNERKLKTVFEMPKE